MRGNNRGPIFLEDLDRQLFLATLGRAKLRCRWRIHAYCLMDNHYHLLVETPEPNIAQGMQWLNTLYAHGFNRRNERIGHLFQRRYAAEHITDEAHLREVVRYIPLNPVRAGASKRAEEYTWSSYGAALGLTKRPPFLTVRFILDLFAHDLDGARRSYRHWVEEGARQPRKSKQRLPLATIIPPGRRVTPEDLRAARKDGYSLSQIGRHLGVSHTWVRRKMATNP